MGFFKETTREITAAAVAAWHVYEELFQNALDVISDESDRASMSTLNRVPRKIRRNPDDLKLYEDAVEQLRTLPHGTDVCCQFSFGARSFSIHRGMTILGDASPK